MVSIQHLSYFLEVAKLKSISAAARRLNLSQPLLSRVIKQMEEELNVTLFVRSTRTFSLTDSGVALMEYAQKILREYSEMTDYIECLAGNSRGTVRLSCAGIFLDCYFTQIIPQFYKENPQLSIAVLEEASKKVPISIIEGSADIGIMMMPLSDSPYLETFPIISDRIALMVRKDHPFAKQKVVNIQQLEAERLLLTGKSSLTHERFVDACERQGFQPNIQYICNMPGFIKMSILNSNAVGVMARPLIEHFFGDEVAIVDLEPPIHWDIAVVHRKEGYIPDSVYKLRSVILHFFHSRNKKTSESSLNSNGIL